MEEDAGYSPASNLHESTQQEGRPPSEGQQRDAWFIHGIRYIKDYPTPVPLRETPLIASVTLKVRETAAEQENPFIQRVSMLLMFVLVYLLLTIYQDT